MKFGDKVQLERTRGLPLTAQARSGQWPVMIDVEASGFGSGSYPIEVGMTLSDGSGRCFLIEPAPEWTHWDYQAESLHGIAREDLFSHGLPVRESARLLNDLLGGCTVYSDGWGVDRSWLALLFAEADEPQKFRVETIRCLLTEHQAERWADTRKRVIRELQLQRHRASTDAKIMQMTYQRVVSKG